MLMFLILLIMKKIQTYLCEVLISGFIFKIIENQLVNQSRKKKKRTFSFYFSFGKHTEATIKAIFPD